MNRTPRNEVTRVPVLRTGQEGAEPFDAGVNAGRGGHGLAGAGWAGEPKCGGSCPAR